jgi:hypothetical protein
VKVFKAQLRICLLLIFAFLVLPSSAANNDEIAPTRISLLTCGPGEEIYSLYGHTAIRVQSPETGDLVVNYGVFSFKQKFFILRFVFGLTDYQMGIVPFDIFMEEYRSEDRWVVEQQLNITQEEAQKIIKALAKNYEPQYRTYRYNYFYDNCTTRARDILINNLNGKVNFKDNHQVTSYREMIHSMNENYRWARFGNDILLGLKSDFKTNNEQQQFLPEHLMKDFDNATITDAGGNKRKLVVQKSDVLTVHSTIQPKAGWFTPTICFSILALLLIGMCLIEQFTKTRLWWLDLCFLVADGLAGLILFAMIFSQHPTVSLNLQILLLNPLSIIFGWKAAFMLRRGRGHWYFKLHAACIFLFIIGAIFQVYAEGMLILALGLLVREIYIIKKYE